MFEAVIVTTQVNIVKPRFFAKCSMSCWIAFAQYYNTYYRRAIESILLQCGVILKIRVYWRGFCKLLPANPGIMRIAKNLQE